MIITTIITRLKDISSPFSSLIGVKDTMIQYTIDAQLSRGGEAVPCDDLTDRVGFRTVGLSDRKLYINNKEARLRGFNRHEDHPHYGAAIPFSMMLKDIYLLSHKTQE